MQLYLRIDFARWTVGIEGEQQMLWYRVHLNILPVVSFVFAFPR
jgi:hypothetical protein